MFRYCYKMDEMQEWVRDGYKVSCDRTKFDIDFVHQFLTAAYWSAGIPRATVEKAIANSLAFGLFAPDEKQNDRQIGMARVVTDYATYGYLADVFVSEGYRGLRLGKWMMDCVMAHPDLQGLRRFGLVTRDAQGLYEQVGFRELGNPGRHMEIVRPDIYLATRPPSTMR